jgi:hypothetical protein
MILVLTVENLHNRLTVDSQVKILLPHKTLKNRGATTTVNITENPFATFRKQCETNLTSALKKVLPEIQITDIALEKPPNTEFGQLASSLCFELAKKVQQKPTTLSENLAKATDTSKSTLIQKVSDRKSVV